MAYRRNRGRVFLNGEDITSDVREIKVRHNTNELVMATVEFYVDNITTDPDGNFVYRLGVRERTDD